MEYLGIKDVSNIIVVIRDKMQLNRDKLNRLDADLGDGDLGLTMNEGFNRIADNVTNFEDENDLGLFIKKCGFVMAEAAPSTMGTLLAIGMIKAGDSALTKKTITLEDIHGMLKNAIDAIMLRGKVKKIGDKTIIDALFPALDALEIAVEQNKSIKDSFFNAYLAAKNGAESTKAMKSTVGKAAVYGEKSIGIIDPGSVVIKLIFESIVDFFNK